MEETSTPFSQADLPITPDGRIYHLDVAPQELAPRIILVGDPGRATYIAETFLRDLTLSREHRGLRSYTGTAEETGELVSVVTSGMGTPSLEIVMGEIYALFHIDFSTRTLNKIPPASPVRCIRVGTSGSLQKDVPLGSLLVSRFAVGMEIAALLYPQLDQSEEEKRLEAELSEAIQGNEALRNCFQRFRPYVVESSPHLNAELMKVAKELSPESFEAITVSNSGFFTPQGRAFPFRDAAFAGVDEHFESLRLQSTNLRLTNMEMECSLLFYLGRLMQMEVATIATAVAHRPTNTFLEDPRPSVANCTRAALRALSQA